MQTVANACARCEERFTRWSDYHEHVTTVRCAKKFRPVNTSGRSKTQIVSDIEDTLLKGAIIR